MWAGNYFLFRFSLFTHCGTCQLSDFFDNNDFEPALDRAREKARVNLHVYSLEKLNCSDLLRPVMTVEYGLEAVNECLKRPETIGAPYHQLLNLHEMEPYLGSIAKSQLLGSLASDLLQKPSIRLYQTGLFRKDPSIKVVNDFANPITSYHRDLNQVPLDTNHFLTFWCPLNDLEPGDSALVYALESHLDVAQFFWYGGDHFVPGRHKLVRYPSLKRGDCVAHHGNMLHAAMNQPESSESRIREAITFSYVDANAKKLQRDGLRPHGAKLAKNMEDSYSFMRWFSDVEEGQVLQHPLVPLVWPPQELNRPLQGIIDTEDSFIETVPDMSWTGAGNGDEDEENSQDEIAQTIAELLKE